MKLNFKLQVMELINCFKEFKWIRIRFREMEIYNRTMWNKIYSSVINNMKFIRKYFLRLLYLNVELFR